MTNMKYGSVVFDACDLQFIFFKLATFLWSLLVGPSGLTGGMMRIKLQYLAKVGQKITSGWTRVPSILNVLHMISRALGCSKPRHDLYLSDGT